LREGNQAMQSGEKEPETINTHEFKDYEYVD